MGTFLPLSNARMFYRLKTKPDIKLWMEIRSGGGGVLSSMENYWRLSVRLSSINPAYRLRYRYRIAPVFYVLKTNPRIQL